jgi:hypothetical protein
MKAPNLKRIMIGGLGAPNFANLRGSISEMTGVENWGQTRFDTGKVASPHYSTSFWCSG